MQKWHMRLNRSVYKSSELSCTRAIKAKRVHHRVKAKDAEAGNSLLTLGGTRHADTGYAKELKEENSTPVCEQCARLVDDGILSDNVFALDKAGKRWLLRRLASKCFVRSSG